MEWTFEFALFVTLHLTRQALASRNRSSKNRGQCYHRCGVGWIGFRQRAVCANSFLLNQESLQKPVGGFMMMADKLLLRTAPALLSHFRSQAGKHRSPTRIFVRRLRVRRHFTRMSTGRRAGRRSTD